MPRPIQRCFQVIWQSVAGCFEKPWRWSYHCKPFVSPLYRAIRAWSLHSFMVFQWLLLVAFGPGDGLAMMSWALYTCVFPSLFPPNSQGETKVLKLKNLRPQDYASYTCQVSVRNVCSIPDKSITFQLTNTTGNVMACWAAIASPGPQWWDNHLEFTCVAARVVNP